MKDQDWNYLIQLSGTTGEGPMRAKFEQLTYSNTLLVAFEEIIDLDLRRFGKGNPSSRSGNYRYDQATIIYQPTGEMIATTHHYQAGGPYFPAGPGLYLELTTPVEFLEQTLAVSLAPMHSRQLPERYLHLGSYQPGSAKNLITHDGVSLVSDQMMKKRMQAGLGVFQLEVRKSISYLIPGADITYHFEELKPALLDLMDKDFTAMNPPRGGLQGSSVSSSLCLSWIGDNVIEVERHPQFLAFPTTRTPGIYFKVPSKEMLEFLSKHVDLFVLPHFEQGKDYFQIATYGNDGLQPTPIPALDQLRQQLQPSVALTDTQTVASYAVDFHYHNEPGKALKARRIFYDGPEDAIKALSNLEVSAFDTPGVTGGSPPLDQVFLFNTSKEEPIAAMFKAKEGKDGLPVGVYLVMDEAQLTPELTAAMGPFLTAAQKDGHYHLLVAKAGEVTLLQRKYKSRPRTIIGSKGSSKHH